MRNMQFAVFVLVSIAWVCPICAQDAPKSLRFTKPDLRTELLEMVKSDQDSRKQLISAPSDTKAQETLAKEDDQRTNRVLEMLRTNGWPTISEVGVDGAGAVWIILQHSNINVLESTLSLMKKAARRGDLEWGLVATSIDRLLVSKGQQQLYGTQFEEKDGKLIPYPIKNRKGLEARRKKVGLGSFEEYRILIEQTYHPSASSNGTQAGRSADAGAASDDGRR